MCGFLFYLNNKEKINRNDLEKIFKKISWRGPDVTNIHYMENDHIALAHHRLTIVDPNHDSDQPMASKCDNYHIVFNGEIYNYEAIRSELGLDCKTKSDTEVILEGFLKIGVNIFEKLDGMFAVVIYNKQDRSWIAARDAFGIKPLFKYESDSAVLFSSEASVISEMISDEFCQESLKEWEIIRRPLPGKTYFKNVEEVLPGTITKSNGIISRFWSWESDGLAFSQDKFEYLLKESINQHLMGEYENVSLLSGGLDSAIITKISGVRISYTVGLNSNNEFEGAQDTADTVNVELNKVPIMEEELISNWKYLTVLRGEPLSLPNEGLIYHVCRGMKTEEKVVLTGEGADELLFGYDNIFRWALKNNGLFNYPDFISRYGYSNESESTRLKDYLENLATGKTLLEFLEDFFYQVHLPGLLRRMDFASMAASKEARVPFVTKSLIKYLYRKPACIKIDQNLSKKPIRDFAHNLELYGALNRKKIGFSAKMKAQESRKESYKKFHDTVKGALKW